MAKIVKLKQSDIENIVNNIIKENMGTSDPLVRKPKVTSDNGPKIAMADVNEDDEMGTEGPEMGGGKQVFVAKDENGTFYLVDAETNQAIGKSK
jgi:hypothetical protein